MARVKRRKIFNYRHFIEYRGVFETLKLIVEKYPGIFCAGRGLGKTRNTTFLLCVVADSYNILNKNDWQRTIQPLNLDRNSNNDNL